MKLEGNYKTTIDFSDPLFEVIGLPKGAPKWIGIVVMVLIVLYCLYVFLSGDASSAAEYVGPNRAPVWVGS